MDNLTCVFPLVNTKHHPCISSCGISCGKSQEFFMTYTSKEIHDLTSILFVLSVATICVAPLYLCIAISERSRIEKSFVALPFAYQSPFFISSGYLLIAIITLSPFLFGAHSIVCNEGEDTLTCNSLSNPGCTLTSLGLYVGSRLAVVYTSALSVSLVLTLYRPKLLQRKRYFHIPVIGFICIGIIPIIMSKSVYGDFSLRFCTYSLSSRSHLLHLDIIPLSGCVLIFFICL
jgi:dolichyl-phosphate-mannose--protein O-mannosyl transferase